MIEGLSHLTFVVKDLDRMTRIIVDVLGGEEVYSSGDETFSLSKEKFFVAGGVSIAAMEGEPLSSRSYNHVAFKVGLPRLEACKKAIQALGLDMKESRPRIDGEGSSLYFHDDDNHLFELHAGTLDERIEAYRQKKERN